MLAGLVLLVVTACGPATLPPGDQIADRDEIQNRDTHAFNVALDTAVVGPVANAYGDIVPRPVRQGIDNFSSNLDQPLYVANNLLQLRIGHAIENTARFVVNTTVGIGGIFDVATAIGLPARETGFGETMHIYGIPEGDYQVLPVLGPSTTRDTVGRIVDFFGNPVQVLTGSPFIDTVVESPASEIVTGTSVASGLSARDELDPVLRDIYENSPDSYVTLRSLYLQNRRFELGGADLTLEDPLGEVLLDEAAQ
ncbi:MAG: VacJ family lipoprotein [Pseudomonadota bacterium]